MLLDKKSFIFCDAPRPWGLYFQNSASPQMEAVVELHDNIMFYLAIILFGVAWIMVSIIRNYVYNRSPISNKYLNRGTLIELFWTITPAFILILIVFPFFKLLYLMDEVTDPSLTLFVEGHQWYWSYQYPDFINSEAEELEFDSYLVPETDLEEGALRMLEVDNRVILPVTDPFFMISLEDFLINFSSSLPNGLPEDFTDGGAHFSIADCTHDHTSPMPDLGSNEQAREEISNTMCDFNPSHDGNRFIPHNAYPEDYSGNGDERRPVHCDRCHAIMCHNCTA